MGLSKDDITRMAFESFKKFDGHGDDHTSHNSSNATDPSSSTYSPYNECQQTMWICLLGVAIGWIGLYRISKCDNTVKGRLSYSITFASFSLSMFFAIFLFCTSFGVIANILSVSFIFCTELSLIFNALVDLGILKDGSRRFCWLSGLTYLLFAGTWAVSSFCFPNVWFSWRVMLFLAVGLVSFAVYGMIEIILVVRQRGRRMVPKLILLTLAGVCAFYALIVSERLDWLGNLVVDIAMIDLLFFYLIKAECDSDAAKAMTLPLTTPFLPTSAKVPPHLVK